MMKIVDESILFFSKVSLSKFSLWKFSTFRGYKGIYSGVCKECEKSVFIQIGHSGDSVSWVEQVARLSRELTAWPDYIFCLVVLQLSWPFSSLHASHVCHFGDLLVARSSCETPLICTLFPAQPLHDSHLYIGYLITKIQANLARIKPTHDWINSTLHI